MSDETRAMELRAREFFANHEYSEFYHAVAYSGYRHATDKQAEIMAAFADRELSVFVSSADIYCDRCGDAIHAECLSKLSALTADKERLQRQLDAAIKGLTHYAMGETWGYGHLPDGADAKTPKCEYLPNGNGYDLAASTLEAIEQENK